MKFSISVYSDASGGGKKSLARPLRLNGGLVLDLALK